MAVAPAKAAYPDRPLTIVVPYPPGGPADAIARPLGVRLGTILGTPVLLKYRPGAGGRIALRQVAKAKNDGYTIVLVLAACAIAPLLTRQPDYDPVTGFEPVSLLARQPLVLYAREGAGLASVSQLIAKAASSPGTVSIATSGFGNTSHLALEMLSQAAGVRLTHVPYNGGVQSVTAVMSGEVDAVFAGTDYLGFARAGRLRALALTSDTRLAISPETPTFADAGIRGMSVEGWYGLLAPRGTPRVRIEKLNLAVEKALSDASFIESASALGFKVVHAGPGPFRSFIEGEVVRWGRLIESRGIGTD